MVIFMSDVDLRRLEAECLLSSKLWGRTFSALTAITYRERGPDAFYKLWMTFLGKHQASHYLQGLKKLGIADDEPPAVKAAKYHYFSNILGGLTLQYMEESPKKVWIRYTAPMWTYAGVSMMTIPGHLRRAATAGWHPGNGRMMGSDRLGWVSTKFIMEGEPYDEGYFIEYDHDIRPEQSMRREIAWSTPEFDPAKAPTLDPVAWPRARVLKARRNYSKGYVRETVESLLDLYGEKITYFIVQEASRCMAVQYTHELKADMAILGHDAEAATQFLAGLLRACDQDFSVEKVGEARYAIALKSFKPFDDIPSDDLRKALFSFQEMAVRLINGRLKITRSWDMHAGPPGIEVWEVSDTGGWRW